MAATSYLTPTQRYAAGALFGLALNQAQIHQTHPLGLSTDDFPSDSEKTSSKLAVSEDPNLWVHEHHALLRPVFKYLFSPKHNYTCLFLLHLLMPIFYFVLIPCIQLLWHAISVLLNSVC